MKQAYTVALALSLLSANMFAQDRHDRRNRDRGEGDALDVTLALQDALYDLSDSAREEMEEARNQRNQHRTARYRFLTGVSQNVGNHLQERVINPWDDGRYDDAKQGFFSLNQNFNNVRATYNLAPNPPRRIVAQMDEINRLHRELSRMDFQPKIKELIVSRRLAKRLQDLSDAANDVVNSPKNPYQAQRFRFLRGVSNNVSGLVRQRIIDPLNDRDFDGAKQGLNSLRQNFNNVEATYNLSPDPTDEVIEAMDDVRDLLRELRGLPFRQRRR